MPWPWPLAAAYSIRDEVYLEIVEACVSEGRLSAQSRVAWAGPGWKFFRRRRRRRRPPPKAFVWVKTKSSIF